LKRSATVWIKFCNIKQYMRRYCCLCLLPLGELTLLLLVTVLVVKIRYGFDPCGLQRYLSTHEPCDLSRLYEATSSMHANCQLPIIQRLAPLALTAGKTSIRTAIESFQLKAISVHASFFALDVACSGLELGPDSIYKCRDTVPSHLACSRAYGGFPPAGKGSGTVEDQVIMMDKIELSARSYKAESAAVCRGRRELLTTQKAGS
jgi:hypothetical protein